MLGARGAVSAMGCRCAAPLLAHVNLLLVLYGGASLATAARLKWDPTTYIAVREMFPVEYSAMAVGVAAGGFVLLLLPHLAAAALLASRATRRVLLLVYAGALSALVLCQLVLAAWLTLRVFRWLESDAARQLQEVMELRENLKPVLRYFGRWHPAPVHLEHLIKEAEEDAPRNLYVAVAAGALLAVLQPLAIALALCEARRAPPAPDASGATVALVPRIPSGWSVWRSPRRVATRCATFVVNIYYREKPRWLRLQTS